MSDMSAVERLEKQLALIVEIDQLKAVLRRTRVRSDAGRLENSAEHSWQVALMAVLLQEHANEAVDVAKVVKMLLIHDVVEIDAGDTFVYDLEAAKLQPEKELKAAKRIFGLLPEDQRDALMALWLEFEAGETPEARYGKALDRMLPMLLNYHSEGQSWKEYGVRHDQALKINSKIEKGSVLLWEKVQTILTEAAEKGWLKK
ncbi:HD domain-containing protein [Grimontia sp. NTOU-MAR1]|uniref:HD domain-containing protein n=1 Tax=Grimontia sp. NTOU-MAR1 TaxID=3111011 RepID=UPI002DBD45AA|nr:HD domain-containing protein [Grimontia sp. NTOU-MAR1]WRV98808.1 HD domain-containing protein [Grimontia sp. NTOU-MAR1]